jgi:propionyl-CoA carboxylase beta chain
MGAPMIGLNDSGGARIQEGVRSWVVMQIFFIETYKLQELFRKFQLWDPAPVEPYSPAMTDFTMMVEDTSYVCNRSECGENRNQ